MKKLFLTACLFATLPLSAQVINLDGGITRAVVVGISDYQDPAIPDLRFADRDAEAFAEWLGSPAGGSLTGDHLKLLLNEQATLGQLVAALGWLLQESSEGDQIVIYFSGHGDVDAKIVGSPGFLLLWDTPAQMYMAGGYGLWYFQAVVNTLTEGNKAKVLVVTDACHAGKLAGNDIGGAQITNANLAKLFGSETKILSCQPNEFSIEGEEWGGGRGAFSYHLVDGLYGLADQNADAALSLSEIDRYLEDHVTVEVSPLQQTPMVVGDRRSLLAQVHAEALAAWRQGKKGQTAQLNTIEQRGIEDETLAKVDTSIRRLYFAFKKALRDKVFLEPADDCADAYYCQLVAVEALKPLHGSMTRNFAAALMDEGQQVTNKLLRTDPQVVSDALSRPFVFDHIHRYLARAGELLGEGHFYYKPLMTRQRYFEALTYRSDNYPDWTADSVAKTFQRKMEEGLQFDSMAAYIYLGLAMQNTFVNSNLQNAALSGRKAVELAPNCAAAYFFLGNSLSNLGEHKNAIPFLEKAIVLDSTFFPSYLFLGLSHGAIGSPEKYFYYLEKFVFHVRLLISTSQDDVPIFYYSQLGNALWKLGLTGEAKEVLLKAFEKSNGKASNALFNLMCVYNSNGQFNEAIQTCNLLIELVPDNFYYYAALAAYYQQIGEYEQAEKVLKKAIEITKKDTTGYCLIWRSLGDLYSVQGRLTEAHEAFRTVLLLRSDPTEYVDVCTVGRATHALHGESAMLEFVNQYLIKFSGQSYVNHVVACNYALAGEPEKALKWLEQGISKDINICWWILADFDLVSLQQTEGYQALCRKCFPDWGKE